MPLPNKNELAQEPVESQSRVRQSDKKIQISGEVDSHLSDTSSEKYIIEELDTSAFELPSMDANKPVIKDPEVVTSAPPIQPTKASKLRKFKGHRKSATSDEKDTASAMSIDDRVDYFKERLKKGETEEQIALAIAIKETSKEEGKAKPEADHKAYSPNRSFMDLLNDSERRKLQHSRTDPETTWNQVSGSKVEVIKEKGSNFKMLILIGIAVLAISVAAVVIYEYIKESSHPSESGENTAGNSQTNGIPPTIQNQPDDKDADENSDHSLNELKSKIMKQLKDYHDSTDPVKKASLCRVPNRTLSDMKKYYSDREKNYKVVDVQIGQASFTKGQIKFTQAAVKLEQDGVEDFKYAYFSEDGSGNMKLDWHSYIGFEAISWRSYLISKADTPMDWHLTINFNGDLHPDFSEKKFVALNVRSWMPNTVDSTNAMLSKEDPMYEKLVDAYEAGQRTFILKVRHIGDIASSLVVDEIISLSEFYVSDTDAE
jgi:hypothetical protein